MRTDPYLFFSGRCADALDFYCGTLGARIETLVPDANSQVMHAVLRVGETTVLASDGRSKTSLSLQVDDDAEAERVFAALADQGTVEIPLMSTPFASRFGTLTDRFGTSWLIVTRPHATR